MSEGDVVPEDVTLGEVARSVEDLRSEVRGIRDKLEKLPDTDRIDGIATAWNSALTASETATALKIQLVEKEAAGTKADLDRRVSSLESWNTWLVRIVGAMLIGAVVALVLSAGPTT